MVDRFAYVKHRAYHSWQLVFRNPADFMKSAWNLVDFTWNLPDFTWNLPDFMKSARNPADFMKSRMWAFGWSPSIGFSSERPTSSHPGGDNSMTSRVPHPKLPHPNFNQIMMSMQNMQKTDFPLFDVICCDVRFCTIWQAIIGDSQPLLGYFSFETVSNVCLHVNTWRHNDTMRLITRYLVHLHCFTTSGILPI